MDRATIPDLPISLAQGSEEHRRATVLEREVAVDAVVICCRGLGDGYHGVFALSWSLAVGGGFGCFLDYGSLHLFSDEWSGMSQPHSFPKYAACVGDN